jgi:hypothetical protein
MLSFGWSNAAFTPINFTALKKYRVTINEIDTFNVELK